MSDLELFHVAAPTPPEPAEKLSADRRRTAKQHALVAAGVHPLTRGKALPELGTCGGCAHRVLLGYHNRTWPKCDQREITHGAGSDCRAWWPACDRFEPGDGISDDAARWMPSHVDHYAGGTTDTRDRTTDAPAGAGGTETHCRSQVATTDGGARQ